MEDNYSGTLRITNPKTLEKWVKNWNYKELIDEGYYYAIGCGIFRTFKCDCSQCRKKPTKTTLEIENIINNNN